MAYTTTKLLNAIDRRAFVPTGQTTFTQPERLQIADEVTETYIVPAIIAIREEFFIYLHDYTITANQAAYDVPDRSVGMQVRDVQYLSGENINPDFRRYSTEQITSTKTGNPDGFYFRNNQIILYPTPANTQDTLRVPFALHPSALVVSSEGATISAIDTDNNIVTVTTIPSTWTTGNQFDLIKGTGAHECRAIDQTSTLVSGSSITFSSLPSDLVVGDYMALAGESTLVQLPPGFRAVLAQLTAAEIRKAMGLPGAEKAMEKGMDMLEAQQKLIAIRSEGEPEYIIPSLD